MGKKEKKSKHTRKKHADADQSRGSITATSEGKKKKKKHDKHHSKARKVRSQTATTAAIQQPSHDLQASDRQPEVDDTTTPIPLPLSSALPGTNFMRPYTPQRKRGSHESGDVDGGPAGDEENPLIPQPPGLIADNKMCITAIVLGICALIVIIVLATTISAGKRGDPSGCPGIPANPDKPAEVGPYCKRCYFLDKVKCDECCLSYFRDPVQLPQCKTYCT